MTRPARGPITVRPGSRTPRPWAAGACLAGLIGLAACAGPDLEPVTVGLITKQEENPYWVTVREVAEQTAAANDITLLTATGTSDTDVQSQREALIEMTEAGVDGILISVTDSTALLPEIEAARAAGVVVIAIDTPVQPPEATDALFATDNVEAGRLVGDYAVAKADELGITPRIAMLNLSPGIASGEERGVGFLEGFGIRADDPALIAAEDTAGDREAARAAMSAVLDEHPDVNVVYTVNEPAALGALEVIEERGMNLDAMVVVSIDGGCEAIKDAVRPGRIDATAQQFPENMGREGVLAVADAVRDGAPVSGYLDTGLQLISGDPAPGVDSRNVEYGVRNCWG